MFDQWRWHLACSFQKSEYMYPVFRVNQNTVMELPECLINLHARNVHCNACFILFYYLSIFYLFFFFFDNHALTKYWGVPTKDVQMLPWSKSFAYPRSIILYTVWKNKSNEIFVRPYKVTKAHHAYAQVSGKHDWKMIYWNSHRAIFGKWL